MSVQTIKGFDGRVVGRLRRSGEVGRGAAPRATSDAEIVDSRRWVGSDGTCRSGKNVPKSNKPTKALTIGLTSAQQPGKVKTTTMGRIMRTTKNFILAAAALLISGVWVQSASAAAVISDDFDTGTPGGNWPGDSVFLSIPQPGNVQGLPSVDLVGPGYYGYLAYSGNSVDLDGSTGTGNRPAGELQSITSLATGNYAVSFLLSGNQRGAPEQQLAVAIGNSAVQLLTPLSDTYTLYTLYFTGVSGQLTFTDLGPSNQQGDLLDNVSVFATPLPATWSMLLAGFVGLGFLAFRGARNRSALVSAL